MECQQGFERCSCGVKGFHTISWGVKKRPSCIFSSFAGSWNPRSGDQSGQIITTSAEVTLNGGLIRESPQNPLNSGLGIIVICPDQYLATTKQCFPAESLFFIYLELVQKKTRCNFLWSGPNTGNFELVQKKTMAIVFEQPPPQWSCFAQVFKLMMRWKTIFFVVNFLPLGTKHCLPPN